MRNLTESRLETIGTGAREVAACVEEALQEQYALHPERFPGAPKVLHPRAVSTDVNGWTGNFDDEAPWPGEWDNTGGG